MNNSFVDFLLFDIFVIYGEKVFLNYNKDYSFRGFFLLVLIVLDWWKDMGCKGYYLYC